MTAILKYITLGTALFLMIGGCTTTDSDRFVRQPALADSLSTIYGTLKEATIANDPDGFFACLDPIEAYHIKKLSSSNGYRKVKSFIERKYAFLPDLDTLNFHELRQGGDFVRLTYIGPGTSFGYRTERARFTFLLFREFKSAWKLSAMSSIERDRFDRYGYEISYHETDLPPKFRFPRIL